MPDKELIEKIAHLRGGCDMSNCQHQPGTWECDLCFASQICQLFPEPEDSPMYLAPDGQWKVKPKPEYSRLLTEEEVRVELVKSYDKSYKGEITEWAIRAGAKAQLAKDKEWEDEYGFIKETEWRAKVTKAYQLGIRAGKRKCAKTHFKAGGNK